MARAGIATVSLAGIGCLLLVAAIACESEFRQYPAKLAGLTPVRVPIATNQVLRTSFKAVWSEPHYVALVFPSDVDPESAQLLAQANRSVGAARENPVPFDFDWRAFEGGTEVGQGSGRARPTGAFALAGASGRQGLGFGEFQVIAGRTYDLELRSGPAFDRFARLGPMIEVGVNTAGPSVGLPWVKEFSRPVAIVLASFGLLFLAGAIWTFKK